MAIFGKKPVPAPKATKFNKVGEAAAALLITHYTIQTIDAVASLISDSITNWRYSRKAKAELKKAHADMNTKSDAAGATQEAQKAVDPNVFTVDQEVVEAVLRRSEQAKQEEQSEAANG